MGQRLSAYRLLGVDGFDAAIKTNLLDDLGTFEAAEADFDAKLFVQASDPTEPPWAAFLQDGFPASQFVSSASMSAALLVRIRYFGADRYFAFAFGTGGRFLLRPEVYEPRAGLRVALNLMYEDAPGGAASELPPQRVRQVDSRTVSDNTLHTRRQANRRTTFETFEIDTERDLLSGITGQPRDREDWGGRVTGADALTVTVPIEFAELGAFCRRFHMAQRSNDYERHFSWIDNVSGVRDPQLRTRLVEALATAIRTDQAGELELTPPGLLDWDDVDSFEISNAPEPTHELDLADYITVLRTEGKLDDFTINRLRNSRVLARNGEGDVTNRWTLLQCTDGEIALDGKRYLAVGGEFFEVAAGYLAELDVFIDSIEATDEELPTAREGESEGDYNDRAAQASDSRLLMDKVLVRVPSVTGSIEFCDILTDDKKLVHVKRKARSSSLSHLFGQGAVSGDLFLMNPEFRAVALSQVQAAEQARGPTFAGRFATFDLASLTPQDYEVVYAIIEKWKDKGLSQRLPFFSKVNLRHHTSDLRRMGFRVTHARIEVTDADNPID